MRTLIVFSHLRWNFVFQRPQQVLTRLAQHFKVLFVEEPMRGNATPFLERYSPAHNVEVLRPRTTVDAPGFDDAQFREISDLLVEYLDDFGIDDYLAWFYTPMAVPLLAGLRPRAVIYDCIDELSAFGDAPELVHQREAELMRRADIVFTGGPSLYEAKRRHHPNVTCLPSAVDAAHFAPASVSTLDADVRRCIDDIPSPRLGFFGVIDERFDTELVAALADARPDWQLVMVGPVVKIDIGQLPRRDNIHWLGQQPCEKLPQFVSSWDVCLLPFANNASTRFISPTKTLEYMAAERPIVSTPVRDVVTLYGDTVSIAATARAFVLACERALAESAADRAVRIARMRAHVSRTTWDATARSMLRQIRSLPALRDASIAVARDVATDQRARSAGGGTEVRTAGKAMEVMVGTAVPMLTAAS